MTIARIRLSSFAIAVGALTPVSDAPSVPANARDVEIRSFDGQALEATYFSPGRAGPAVMMFRNCDQKRSELTEIATKITALGVHVMTWDYRAGVASNVSWAETRARDASAIHDWLVSQPGVDGGRIVAIGGSCGVALALDYAERNLPRVRGVVLLSGPSSANQRTFVSRTPSLAIFGAASKAEGAAVFYIDSVVKASANPLSRQSVPDDAGHGVRMLTQDARLGADVLSWMSNVLALQSSGPSARNSHAMAAGASGVVMFGGAGSGTPRLQDTLWQWSGDAWQPMPGEGPRSRNMPAMAFDSRRNVLVLYGGTGVGSGTKFGDTWEWNGQRWHERNVRTPGPRDHHAMAFDEARGNTVMYGGSGGSGLANGTWTWDSTEWKLADSVSGPGPLVHHAMAYDRRRGRIVMYGGINSANQRQSDTWEWDGRQWERASVSGGPGPRSHHRMAFDAHNGVTVLFGGGDTTATATWTYDGTTWRRHDVVGPEPRWSSAMAYDATRARVVLFGGGQNARPYGSLSDTWTWDGVRWQQPQR